ncbi:MAG: DUF1127 domain-containing protein [Albidovulum sp.]
MAQSAHIRQAAPIRTKRSTVQATLFHLISVWRFRRRSRASLALLDDRMLKDIGLDRADCYAEVRTPFWR